MYFEAGDTLYVEVKKGTAINKAGIAGRTVASPRTEPQR